MSDGEDLKLDIPDTNLLSIDVWTDNLEDILRMWGEKAAGYRDLHLSNSRYWNIVSHRLSIPIIFLTTITSVSTFSAIGYDDHIYWMYTVGTVNLITAFLTGLSKYIKPDELALSHKQIGRSFGCFHRKILLELGLAKSNRQDPSSFVSWAKNEYDRLVTESPILSKHIIEDYTETTKNLIDVYKPDIVDNNNRITINRD